MPQFTIKLHTYDPDIVDAFDRLRRNRKQAAFTHEALKHFIASGKASLMIALMSDGQRPGRPEAGTGRNHEETIKAGDPAVSAESKSARLVTGPGCDDVLGKIFK